MGNCQIQERTNHANVLHSKPSSVTLKTPTVKKAETLQEEFEEEEEFISKAELLQMISNGFRDIKLMREGKMKEKTLDELIYELRNSND